MSWQSESAQQQRLISTALNDALRPAQSSGAHGFVLVDASLLPDHQQLCEDTRGHETLVLHPTGSTGAAAKRALPWLITLPSDGERRDRLVANSVRWALEHHAASWLTSEHPPSEVAAALNLRLNAMLPDAMRIVLRYADARVLVSLAGVLDDAQAQTFFSFASGWWSLDRSMRLISPQDPRLSGTAKLSEPSKCSETLHLSTAQQAALLEASEPDAVIGLLRQKGLSEIDALPPGPRHALVRSVIDRSCEFGVQATADYALLCLVALDHGEEFMDDPVWRLALEQVKSGHASVSDALVSAAEAFE